MLTRLWNRFTYWLERQMVRGAQYRLLVIAAGIGLISFLGGALVLALGAGFTDLGAAVWWAFLRLTDPGYLGDDVGTVNRILSTLLTVAGYVVFLGALVAVMTQWLDARMERLEAGLTPVARNDHVLVLGWTNRTDAIVEELLLSEERVRRFLRRHGSRELHVVVMARQVDAARIQDLRDAVGEAWDEQKVTLRSGNPLRMEHLARVDYLNAAAVIVPGTEFGTGGVGRMDAHTLKTLLSLDSEPDGGGRRPDGDGERRPDPDELPLTVAEIFDVRKVPVARRAYRGDLELVASDAVVSRLLAQNVRHPGLSHVYNQLLSHGEGAELYLRQHPELDGRRFEEVAEAFDGAVPLGVVRREPEGPRPHLDPPPGFELEASDRMVFLTEGYNRADLPASLPGEPVRRGRPGDRETPGGSRSVLVLGWNHKVPVLLREFGTYGGEGFDVRIVSTVAAASRERVLARYDLPAEGVSVEHVQADYTDLTDLRRVEPAAHDCVMLVGSDRLGTEEESDARSIVGRLLLGEVLPEEGGPQTLLELLDPENVSLVDASRGEVIISPLILSHMLAHVALRPELRSVFDALFTAGGPEITFEPLAAYGVEETDEGEGTGRGRVTFREVRRAAHARGEIALGMRTGPGAAGTHLNPLPDARFPAREDVQVVTLLTY